MSKVESITKKGKKSQKCITVAAPDGLFVLGNGLVTHNSDDYIMRIFNDTKSRIDSRMKGNYYGRSILDSSPNTLDSPIDDYIVNHARKDKTNFIVEGSQWKWAPEEFDMTKTFSVYTGGKGQPPRLLEDDEPTEALSPEKLIKVPTSLKQYFIDDLYKALKDRAGIPAGSADSLVYDYSKIEGIFNPQFKNVYTHIQANTDDTPKKLIWDQIAYVFFKDRAGKKEFWYKPHLPRCISVDQSLSQDVSCIAMSHVERLAGTDEQMFVTDFTIPIAPEGKRINLDAIKFFIEDLRDVGNLNITNISFDQFQSEASIQYLKAVGFDAEKLSVDATTDPYMYLLSLLNTKRLVIGKNLYVKNNLKSLKLVKPNNKTSRLKVDHEDSKGVITSGSLDWHKSRIGFYSKDATDAMAASIELLRRYHPIAYDFWDESYLEKLTDPAIALSEAEDRNKALLAKMGFSVD